MSRPVGSQISGACACAREVDEQREQRERDQHGHERLVAGQEAEGDARGCACSRAATPGRKRAFFAGHDRVFDDVLGELVERHHDQRDDRPRAATRAARQARGCRSRLRSARRAPALGQLMMPSTTTPVDHAEHDDRDDRAEVEAAEGREDAAEDPQERLAHVAQERRARRLSTREYGRRRPTAKSRLVRT